MKYAIGCLLILVIGLTAQAQQNTDTATTAGSSQMWLTNSNKVVVKQDGGTVDRAFFAADKVYIGSNNQTVKKEDKYIIIIDGTKSRVVFNEEKALLTKATKERILQEPPGTQIVFSRGFGKNRTSITIILQ